MTQMIYLEKFYKFSLKNITFRFIVVFLIIIAI